MYVYVCMFVLCTPVCTHVYLCTQPCVHVCWVHGCVYVCMDLCCICMDARMCICIFAHVCVVWVCMFVLYISMHTSTHIYASVSMCTCVEARGQCRLSSLTTFTLFFKHYGLYILPVLCPCFFSPTKPRPFLLFTWEAHFCYCLFCV